MKSLKYIQNYQMIYRAVIKEAKKKKREREADKLILSAKNKNKALWNIIHKETGKSQQRPNIIINTGTK